MHSSPFLFFFHILQAEPEPISIYHPMAEEVSTAMGTPMEGFFDGAEVVVEAMAPVTPAAARGVLVETPIPSTKPRPVEGVCLNRGGQ